MTAIVSTLIVKLFNNLDIPLSTNKRLLKLILIIDNLRMNISVSVMDQHLVLNLKNNNSNIERN